MGFGTVFAITALMEAVGIGLNAVFNRPKRPMSDKLLEELMDKYRAMGARLRATRQADAAWVQQLSQLRANNLGDTPENRLAMTKRYPPDSGMNPQTSPSGMVGIGDAGASTETGFETEIPYEDPFEKRMRQIGG